MADAVDEPKTHLRVALVTDWFLPRLGGIELHLDDLARELAAHGHAPAVLTTTPGPPSATGIPVRRLPVRLAPRLDLAISPALLRTLRTELAAGQYDVVHAHISVVSPVGYCGILAARSIGLPLVVTFHSVLLRTVPTLRALDRLFGWSRWPMLVSAVSELVASQARRAAADIEVRVLSNGIDPAPWQTAAHNVRSADDVVVACTMRLHRKKRPLALLQAFRQARDETLAKGRRLILRIAGDGPERRRMESYIAEHGMQRDVELLGVLPRATLAEIYSNADLFALPTMREAFGLAALEARCAGRPVIAMRAAGATEFLHHGENSLLASDDDEFARHLARLALDDALRTRLAPPDAGLSRYAWPAVIDAHVACYRRAIEVASSARGP
jgi:glycosyltransferase involved in cell wall biosynthesis